MNALAESHRIAITPAARCARTRALARLAGQRIRGGHERDVPVQRKNRAGEKDRISRIWPNQSGFEPILDMTKFGIRVP